MVNLVRGHALKVLEDLAYFFVLVAFIFFITHCCSRQRVGDYYEPVDEDRYEETVEYVK